MKKLRHPCQKYVQHRYAWFFPKRPRILHRYISDNLHKDLYLIIFFNFITKFAALGAIGSLRRNIGVSSEANTQIITNKKRKEWMRKKWNRNGTPSKRVGKKTRSESNVLKIQSLIQNKCHLVHYASYGCIIIENDIWICQIIFQFKSKISYNSVNIKNDINVFNIVNYVIFPHHKFKSSLKFFFQSKLHNCSTLHNVFE